MSLEGLWGGLLGGVSSGLMHAAALVGVALIIVGVIRLRKRGLVLIVWGLILAAPLAVGGAILRAVEAVGQMVFGG